MFSLMIIIFFRKEAKSSYWRVFDVGKGTEEKWDQLCCQRFGPKNKLGWIWNQKHTNEAIIHEKNYFAISQILQITALTKNQTTSQNQPLEGQIAADHQLPTTDQLKPQEPRRVYLGEM